MMTTRTYLVYNLFQLIKNHEFFSTKWELIESIDAEKENIKNINEAFDYFKNKMSKVETDAYIQESMNNLKREGEQIGYLVTFGFKQERTLDADFSDDEQDSDDDTDPNYCKACQSSPCECSDPDRTSTVV